MKKVIDAVKYYGGCNFVNGKHEEHHTHILFSHIDSSFFSAYASDIGVSTIICTIKEFNQCVEELSEAKWMSKPAFTQAMVDNGELPSVGMEYLCGDGQLNRCLVVYGDICIGLAIEHVETNDYLPLSQTSRGDCKPLTPPIKLEDGKAYQFTNIEENTINGIYSEDEHSFQGITVEWSVEGCTNIQLLTVEGGS